MSQYATGSNFPSDLIEAVNRAHEEASEENTGEKSHVFVLAHEIAMSNAESEFTIEGVFSTLSSANERTMDTFTNYYTDYQPSDFYAHGIWQVIGENSVGWYVSRNGTLALEIHDDEGNTCRIYSEEHEIE